MSAMNEVVITGYGVVCPLGASGASFWSALVAGQSGIRRIAAYDELDLPVRIAGQVQAFDPKPFVTNRKSLKLMAREAKLAVAAASLAASQAHLAGGVDPERLGVILGADALKHELPEVADSFRAALDPEGQFQMQRFATEGLAVAYPLNFLKVLPNMLASHISIIHDARGPNNTLHHAELSSLMALREATHVIQRGAADCMLVGGSSSRLHPLDFVRGYLLDSLVTDDADPSSASRPFDAQRRGQVRGEGAAVFVVERRAHAEARGAKILARIAGCGATCQPKPSAQLGRAEALGRSIDRALAEAGLTSADVGHVNAHGLSTVEDDRLEAAALADRFPETPVTALKSYFGNLGAAAGAVEMVGSLLALQHGLAPPTLNYERPDPDCPIHVVHGRPLQVVSPVALLVNETRLGQAAALVLTAA